MAQVETKMHVIFVPDPFGYQEMRKYSKRRAQILLEFKDEVLLRDGKGYGFKGYFAKASLETNAGRLSEEAIQDLVIPKVEEYSDKWREWQIAIKGKPEHEVGHIGLVSAEQQSGVYYYCEIGGEDCWCHRGLSLEYLSPEGGAVPFQISRPIQEKQVDGPVFFADVQFALTHRPIDPLTGGPA